MKKELDEEDYAFERMIEDKKHRDFLVAIRALTEALSKKNDGLDVISKEQGDRIESLLKKLIEKDNIINVDNSELGLSVSKSMESIVKAINISQEKEVSLEEEKPKEWVFDVLRDGTGRIDKVKVKQIK